MNTKTPRTATFSQLLREPNSVLGALAEAGEVVITRRNAPSLRLTEESSGRAHLGTLGIVGQLFAASLDEVGLKKVAARLSVPLPWIALLPDRVHAEFVADFQDTARACIAVGNFDRLGILLEAWKATAEAYADPTVTPDGTDLDYLPPSEADPVPDPRG